MKLGACPIMEGPTRPSSAAKRRSRRIERLVETGNRKIKNKERPLNLLIGRQDASSLNGNSGSNASSRNNSSGGCNNAIVVDANSGICVTCCDTTNGLNLIQSGGLLNGPPRRNNHNTTEILIRQLSDTNRIKLTRMHRIAQSSQSRRAKRCLGLMLTLVTLLASGGPPSHCLGFADALSSGLDHHQRASSSLPPMTASSNTQKILIPAQSDLKRSTLNNTANQLMMAANTGLFKDINEPLSASLTTLSVATASKGALERGQATPALASQPVETMVAAASKKKKKKMMKKKKMEKKHKEWKKGKKHKKKKFESKKKKGGSSKKKKGKFVFSHLFNQISIHN